MRLTTTTRSGLDFVDGAMVQAMKQPTSEGSRELVPTTETVLPLDLTDDWGIMATSLIESLSRVFSARIIEGTLLISGNSTAEDHSLYVTYPEQ